MQEEIIKGRGRELISIRRADWEMDLARVPRETAAALAFMTQDHHRVRYFAVEQLARSGRPLATEFIAGSLRLKPERARAIIADLERHLFFLVTSESGDVSWAFPVTAEKTPHRLEFGSGEHIQAA